MGKLFTLLVLVAIGGVNALLFTWPNETVVCGVYPFNLTGGFPPFNSFMMQVPCPSPTLLTHGAFQNLNLGSADGLKSSFHKQPIQIVALESRSGIYNGGYVEAGSSFPAQGQHVVRLIRTSKIQVQFTYGSYYLMLLSDSAGFGAGGASPVQLVGGGPSDCLNTAGYNATLQLFSFNVSGSAAECESGFRLTWDGAPNQGPYNFSVIPLDGGYMPWVVPVDANANYYDWQVNLTEGSYFTIMFNNELSWGGGGVGGVYQVTKGKSPGCATQIKNTSGLYTLPAGLGTEALPTLQAVSTNGGGNSGMSAGAIAGIAIGAAVGVVGILAGAYLLWRRSQKRRSKEKADRGGLGPIDMVGDDGRNPFVEPFTSQVSPWPPATGHDARDHGFNAHHPQDSRASLVEDSDVTAAQGSSHPYSSYSNPMPSSGHPGRGPAGSTPSPLSPEARGEKTGLLAAHRSDNTTAAGGSMPADTADDENGHWRDNPRIHRAADAGPVPVSASPANEVELPPLYTDITNSQES